MAKGKLIVKVYNGSIANPVEGAEVRVLKDGIEYGRYMTNVDGITEEISLDTVDKMYSEEEQYNVRPYETYDVVVSAIGMNENTIEGVQIFAGVTSLQEVYLTSIDEGVSKEKSIIPPNSLWEGVSANNLEGDYDNGIAPIVLKKVVIPSTIVVHDGIPSNSNAANYTVGFTDYIKNVASSEIYSTWPYETIKANVIAIISFTLNRIYTEWYRSRGYDFTITSTSSYDQKYTRNGTIFDSISKVVDEVFTSYIRSGVRVEPLLAHYKSKTNEPGYLSQWGSKDLGDKGYDVKNIKILLW